VRERPSGGWGAYNAAEAARRRRKLEDEIEAEEEREALAERLEQALIEDGSLTRADAELLRLAGIAAQYAVDDLPNRVRRALAYAERARTELAIAQAQREMARLRDEEDLAVLMLLALD